MAQDAASDSGLRDLCPDRPLKGAASCTVDEGHFQLETDLFNAALQDAGGTSTNTYLFTSPTLKYGLTDRFDVEINMVPYETVETRDDHSGQHSRLSGAGDLYLRAKYNLFGNGGDGPGLALYPYVKAPTAGNGLGNGAWDGGLIVPASFGLPDNCALAVTPEIDIVEDADQTGHHTAVSTSIGITKPLGDFSIGGEIWGAADFDPIQTTVQYSLDFAGTWAPFGDRNLQIDVGINFGLNHATPDYQPYLGLTRRF